MALPQRHPGKRRRSDGRLKPRSGPLRERSLLAMLTRKADGSIFAIPGPGLNHPQLQSLVPKRGNRDVFRDERIRTLQKGPDRSHSVIKTSRSAGRNALICVSVAAGKRPMMTRFMDECSQGVLAPGHILARRRLHQDLSVFHGELPPQPHLPDAAGGDEAFIGVVVHIGHAVLRSDHMAGAGVVDHDVRVAAGRARPSGDRDHTAGRDSR